MKTVPKLVRNAVLQFIGLVAIATIIAYFQNEIHTFLWKYLVIIILYVNIDFVQDYLNLVEYRKQLARNTTIWIDWINSLLFIASCAMIDKVSTDITLSEPMQKQNIRLYYTKLNYKITILADERTDYLNKRFHFIVERTNETIDIEND